MLPENRLTGSLHGIQSGRHSRTADSCLISVLNRAPVCLYELLGGSSRQHCFFISDAHMAVMSMIKCESMF